MDYGYYNTVLNVLKIFGLSSLAFFIGIFLAPFLTHYLYKYKMWKKKSGKKIALGGGETTIFNELHKERDTGTPRMGGIIIWASVLVTILVFWLIFQFFPSELTKKLNFLSREQTWLLLFTLVFASAVGLIEDFLIGFAGAWWFFTKLEVSSIIIPFLGQLELGWFFIPFFMLVMLALFSGGVIDGLDGLSGGVMAAIFSSYAGIAFFQN